MGNVQGSDDELMVIFQEYLSSYDEALLKREECFTRLLDCRDPRLMTDLHDMYESYSEDCDVWENVAFEFILRNRGHIRFDWEEVLK